MKKYRIGHIPYLWNDGDEPGENGVFYYPVESIDEALHLCKCLLKYDSYMHEHQLIPKNANVTTVEFCDSDGQWSIWTADDGREFCELLADYISKE